jgi:hypothetical protein
VFQRGKQKERRKKGKRGECEKNDTGVIGKEVREIVKRHVNGHSGG